MKLFLLLLTVTTFAEAGIHVRNLWKKKNISVCFAPGETSRRISRNDFVTSDWSGRNKRRVQKWISEEYSLERTNIAFTGFSDCKANDNSDVILFYHANSIIQSYFEGGVQGITQSIGPGNYVDDYPDAINAVLISKSGMNKSIVVHEFGHVLGLAHEHNHRKAQKYEGCDLIAPVSNEVLVYYPYDPSSVMNYCYIFEHKNAGLSENDVQLLKRIYQ